MSRPRPAAGSVLALAISLILAPQARAAALDLYYERALMSAANARCGLFSPDVAAALAAAEAQARGASLRAGSAGEAVQATAVRARARAAATPCSAADLQLAAGRVRAAFKGYGRLLRMDFPGDVAGWSADRSLPMRAPAWRLSQTSAAGDAPLTLGLAGRWGDEQALVAVSVLDGADAPYAARLVVRDVARASGPYLNQVRAGSTARLPLWARTPPRSASLVYAAQTRGPAEPSLAPRGAVRTIAFRFPPAAAEAIAGLDPREAVTVELLYAGRSGDVVRRAYIEVGDFAAGRAFLAASRR
jgi:hypothetical protein